MVRLGIGALACLGAAAACGGGTAREDNYQSTDLPFKRSVVWKPGATLSDTPDGMRCSGIVVEALSLDGVPIALRGTAVSSDCHIETKDHGWLRFAGNDDLQVSTRQAARFKELLAARHSRWNEYVHSVPFRGEIASPGGGEVQHNDDGTRTCSGLVVRSLNVADRDVELESTAVTSECLVRTKRHGLLQVRSEGERWEVWMTAQQRDALAAGQPAADR